MSVLALIAGQNDRCPELGGRAMMASERGAAMQRISKREQILLRVGVIVAILATLWVFGLFRSGPVVVY